MTRGSIRAPPSTRIGRFRVRLISLGFHLFWRGTSRHEVWRRCGSFCLVGVAEVGTGKVSCRFSASLDAPWARVAADAAAAHAFALDGPLTLLIESMTSVGTWGMCLTRGAFPLQGFDVRELTDTADAVMSDVFTALTA